MVDKLIKSKILKDVKEISVFYAYIGKLANNVFIRSTAKGLLLGCSIKYTVLLMIIIICLYQNNLKKASRPRDIYLTAVNNAFVL